MHPPDSPPTRVVFFQVQNSTAKLSRISQTVQHHFSRKEKILIVVEDEKALAFVDELLWKSPPESFLPHAIVESECQEWVAITKTKKNLNSAKIVFNLCPTPLLIEGPFRTIYDFEDLSSPNKKASSQTRYEAYKQAHFLIESRQ